MAETKRDKQFFSVGRVFFLLIVIPLSLMAFLIANGIYKVGDTARERAVTVLDQKSQEAIKIRAINTADDIANFLRERENDVLVASILPVTESAYKSFVNQQKKYVWIKEDGKIQRVLLPLYTEMAFIDRSGNEVIKAVSGDVTSKAEMKNVLNPANTNYKVENYFSKAMGMSKGNVYISRVTGWYINKSDFEKGKRFSGILRVATPIFDKAGFAGVLALALDYRHLAEFTNHIVPTQADTVFEADASSGNYAYIVDSEGFMISHPVHCHIEGLYRDGSCVPALTKENYEAGMKKGEEVLNLTQLGFMDPGLPEVAKAAAAGQSGIKTYTFGGHTKFAAYAPIKYFSKVYPEPAGFGWVGMGVDVEKFGETAKATSEKIDRDVKSWTSTIILIIIASVILLFGISALLARGIARSLSTEVPAGSEGLVDDRYENDEEGEDK
jgi:hypothetical protein